MNKSCILRIMYNIYVISKQDCSLMICNSVTMQDQENFHKNYDLYVTSEWWVVSRKQLFFFNVHKLHSQSLSVFCSVKTNILKLINVTLEWFESGSAQI